MQLSTYTKSIDKWFGSKKAWHTFARQLVAKGLVKRYDKKLGSGEIVDGYIIIDLEGLKAIV